MSTKSLSELEDQILAEKTSCYSGKWSMGPRGLKGKLKTMNEGLGLFGQWPRISKKGSEKRRRGAKREFSKRPVNLCFSQFVVMTGGI